MLYKHYKDYFISSLDLIDDANLGWLINEILIAHTDHKNIFIIGNGGSAALASHFAQDLAKGTRGETWTKHRIKAQSLTDNTPFITALGNDDGYDRVFEQQLRTYANSGDILIAISGSGSSANILKAVEWANHNKVLTVGVTGFDGGKLKPLSKISIHVELNDMETVESIHSYLLHYIILRLKQTLL